MNITILAVGSRGDVQPAIALGAGLRRAGHSVRVASYAQFESLAREHGLNFGPIAGDIMAVLQSDEGRAMIESRHPGRLLGLIRDTMDESYAEARDNVIAACAYADALVSLGAIYYSADAAAELRGVPHITAVLQPLFATGEFHAPLLPAPPARTPALNRLSHGLSEQLFWQVMRPTMNRARGDFGLAPLPWRPQFSLAVRAGAPALYAFSRLLVPKPADWPSSIHITGFWFLDPPAGYAPPADLADFLAAGDPPVYIGFGSMSTRDPRRTAELVLRALRLSGRRGLLLRGWGGMQAEDLPPGVHMIDAAPHGWLFPRMGAVVHHAGSGTTASGLRAGVPSVLVPFFADQPFWAERVAALGVGPAPIPRARLGADGLARAIERAADPAVVRRAAAVGEIIRQEGGVARAVRVIEEHIG